MDIILPLEIVNNVQQAVKLAMTLQLAYHANQDTISMENLALKTVRNLY